MKGLQRNERTLLPDLRVWPGGSACGCLSPSPCGLDHGLKQGLLGKTVLGRSNSPPDGVGGGQRPSVRDPRPDLQWQERNNRQIDAMCRMHRDTGSPSSVV